MYRKNRKAEITVVCIVLFSALFVLTHHIIAVHKKNVKAKAAAALLAEQEKEAAAASVIPAPFLRMRLQAKAAYVYDLNEGKVLYAQNANQVLPLASLTKLMMALTASKIYPSSTVVTITAPALAQDGDNGLVLGERWSLPKLLDFTLIVSSNDGAYAIAAADSPTGMTTPFIGEMNDEAQTLNLTTLRFYNPNGLDVNTSLSGGYGSAADIASLFAYILKTNPNLLDATSYQTLTFSSLNGIKHVAVNTDDLINKIPDLIASKTGYTDLAGGNLVIAYDAGIDHPIIVAVLGSTFASRFTDVEQLVQASLAVITATDTPTTTPAL